MHKNGISFGAHTLTHPDLTTLTEERIREETGESKARIEDALGAPVTSFAYPYGAVNEQTRAVVAERFACACTDRLGMVTPRSDTLMLERVEAYYLRDVPAAGMIFTPLFLWYLRARDLPRRARRRMGTAVAHRIIPSHADGANRAVEEALHDR
jgi:peptidoglycan/xylan/chitin deacetylase (PgdA/CDA1 family)